MDDTKVLLDENSHNERHLQFLLNTGTNKLTRFNSKTILSKLYTQLTRLLSILTFNGTNSNTPQHQGNRDLWRLCKTILLILSYLTLFILAIIYLFSSESPLHDNMRNTRAKNIAYNDRHKTSKLNDDDNNMKINNQASTNISDDYFKTIPMAYNSSVRWIISSKKCHVPNIDPWYKDVKEYAKVKQALNCSKFAPDGRALTFVHNNKLYFLNDTSKDYSDCCYKRLKRPNNDRELRVDNDCIPIHGNGTIIKHEHIIVKCNNANHTGVHSFIYGKKSVEQKLDALTRKKVKKDGYYNVVFVGIDTMSRLNMYRQMNETLNVLRTEYKMLEFLGYSKVGENTFPNLVPLLAGQSDEQLAAGCWNTTYKNEVGHDVFDDCKFLWNIFARYGYRTFYNEDWPEASTFNYLKPGFKMQPTMFYGRPWHLQAKHEGITRSTKDGSNCCDCAHDQLALDIYLNYLKDYIHTYEHKPHFAFQWLNCPQHDDLNGASTIDGRFADFFRQIKNATNERTFVIFFSDHGYRWGDFLDTYMGHQESSMPFLSISVPQKFQLQHPDLVKNLLEARNTLLTPYDLYRTILDMLSVGLNKSTNSTIANAASSSEHQFNYDKDLSKDLAMVENNNNNFTSLSFLRSTENHQSKTVDTNRNCDEARIPDNYCVCNTFVDVPTNMDLVVASTWFLVKYINEELKSEEEKCSHLTLESIISAKEYRVITNNENMKKVEPSAEYEVKIKTVPGGAIFQEVIRVYGKLEECRSLVPESNVNFWSEDADLIKRLSDVCKFSIHSKSISRLNLYGHQSECLTHSNAELKKMCYCKKFLSTTIKPT